MTGRGNLASQLEAELICAVCQERYTNPRVLPCQHSFCESCLSMAHLAREHRGRLLPCPTCRAVAVLPEAGVPGFPVNYALNNLVQILVSTENEVRRTPHEFCSIHENRKITMYCTECHVTTCSKCSGTSHSTHHTEIIADVIDTERAALHQTLQDMEVRLTKGDEEVNRANEMLEKLTKQTEAAIIKINKAADKALEELSKKKMNLVSQVTCLKTNQSDSIAAYKEELKTRASKTKSVKSCVEKLMNTSNDVAFLQGKSELLSELKEERKSELPCCDAANKWIDFKAAGNVPTQVTCLDLGDVEMVETEPLDTDQVLNSRVNTARPSRDTARGRRPLRPAASHRDSDSESPLQHTFNVEQISQDEYSNALVIRYSTGGPPTERTTRRLHQSAARIRAVHQIGSCGTSLGDFFHPCGMSLLSNGHLVVADQRNNRVQILEENGSFVQMFGNEGSGVREFKSPCDVAVDGNDNIYVLDTRNDRIQVFSADGRFKKILGNSGVGPVQFCKPQSIAISSSGEVVVADSGNNRIQVLTPEGRFSHSFGSDGAGEGEFMEPCGIAIHNHDVYVCDHHNHRIQVFRITGEFVSCFGSFGSEHGQLSYPSSVAVDGEGSVVVSEYGNDRLSVFDSFGRFKMCFGEEGNDLGQFLSPNGLSICTTDVTHNRNIKFYVCDAWNHRLQMLEMIM